MPCRGTLMRRIRTAMVCSTRRRSSACGAVPHGKGGAVNTARETTPTRWELQYDRAADGSVLDVEITILDKQSKGVPIDEQANDDVVHLDRFREADRLPGQAFDPCA